MANYRDVSVEPYLEMPLDPTTTNIPTHSALFRVDTALTIAVDAALAFYDESSADGLSVLSVGVSFGPEADSILCYISEVAPHIGRVTFTGIDISSDAIVRAKDGRYRLPSYFQDDEEYIRGSLPRKLGKLSQEAVTRANGLSEICWVLDTNDLREQHNLSFVTGDLTSDRLPLPDSDLIFCNNVLYHLGHKCADELVDAMVERLKVYGFLSFESAANRVSSADWNDGYSAWRLRLSERLRGVRILPLMDPRSNVPSLFQKLDA